MMSARIGGFVGKGVREADEINIEEYFSYLVQQYEKLVYHICYQATKNQFDAEDLTQETFLSVYRNLDTFDRSYEKAWICRIASNKALDFLKSSQRRQVVEEEEFFTQVPDETGGPEEQYLKKESKQYVKRVCWKLNPPYREVALQHFYQEKPAKQIADEQEKSLKTIQTQLYRAKAMIRKQLEGGEQDG